MTGAHFHGLQYTNWNLLKISPFSRSDFCSADPQQASAKTAAWMPFKLEAIQFEGYTLNYANLLRAASSPSDVYFLFPL